MSWHKKPMTLAYPPELEAEIDSVIEGVAANAPENSADFDDDEDEANRSGVVEDASLNPLTLYMREIGDVALLNRAQEIALASQIENARDRLFDAIFSVPLALNRATLGDTGTC